MQKETWPGREDRRGKLSAFSLTGLGIGGIIGAGYFLGSGLAIREAGPGVVLAFLLGGLVMMHVFGAMTSININRMARGSFRVYAQEFLGPYVGFLLGWMIYASSVLGIASEALAMGVFVRYWLPQIPLAVLALGFAGTAMAVNALGIARFGIIESLMAGIKTLALIAFIIVGGLALTASGPGLARHWGSAGALFPSGIAGVFQAMLVVIFCFSGISAPAMAAADTAEPRKTVPLAAWWISIGTTLLYMLSMGVIVSVLPRNQVTVDQSPFVLTFNALHLPGAASLMNLVILAAAFSVMGASYYLSMEMIRSLTASREAPAWLGKSTASGFYRNIWLFVGISLLAVVALSFVLPKTLYSNLVAASSYFTFVNWITVLATFLVWWKRREPSETYVSPLIRGPGPAWATIAAIATLGGISLRSADFRPGFYAALLILAAISAGYFLWTRHHRDRGPSPARPVSRYAQAAFFEEFGEDNDKKPPARD